MLVLSRKPSESVYLRIRGVIVGQIMCVRTEHSKCRLGFMFDKSVELIRGEHLPPSSAPPTLTETTADATADVMAEPALQVV